MSAAARSAPLSALSNARVCARRLSGAESAARHIHVAGDDGQKIVEVVRHAAGELADSLHLLGLTQRLFDLRAFGDCVSNPSFELFVGFPERSFTRLDCVGRLAPDARHGDVGVDAREQFARRERLGEIVVGAGFEPLDLRFLAGTSREHHDRQVAQIRIARELRAAARNRRAPASSRRSGGYPAGRR